VEVRLKRTVTKPAFLMPLTNPKFDVDVSAAMVNGGAVEMGLSQVCHACGYELALKQAYQPR
jgi:hypothetical protein